MSLESIGRSISTSKLLTGIGALVGIPATCYGGFCIYDSTLPTQGDILLEQGYRESRPKPDKLNPRQVTKDNQWQIDRFDCFDRFFPSVEATLTETEETTDNDFTDFFKITFKNANFGWAVWTHNYRAGVPQKTEKTPKFLNPNECIDDYDRKLWSFHVLFLEKESEKWRVKGGFYLSEAAYFNDPSTAPKIISPSGKHWIEGTQRKISSYSGLFATIPNNRGKSVLEGGNIFMYGNRKSFFGSVAVYRNDFNFIGFYKTSNKKRQTIKAGQSATKIGTNPSTFYAPFKAKKGQWRETPRLLPFLVWKETAVRLRLRKT